MENNIKTVRVTKAQKFEYIMSIIPSDASHVFPGAQDHNGNLKNAPYTFDHDEIVAFLRNECDLLSRKNTGDKKPTKTQEDNEKLKEAIMSYLDTLPATNEDGTDFVGVTCSDVLKNVPEFDGWQVQKVAPLLRQLRDSAGLVTSASVKGRTYFKKKV